MTPKERKKMIADAKRRLTKAKTVVEAARYELERREQQHIEAWHYYAEAKALP